MYRHICNESSPDGPMNGSQLLRKISETLCLLVIHTNDPDVLHRPDDPVHSFDHGGHTVCCVNGSHSSRSLTKLDAAHSPQI